MTEVCLFQIDMKIVSARGLASNSKDGNHALMSTLQILL